MPLPDERPRQSVANLIGRFEQQGKRQTLPVLPVVPRSPSVSSQIAGDAAKEEIKEKREWPPQIPVSSPDIKPVAPTLPSSPSPSMSKSPAVSPQPIPDPTPPADGPTTPTPVSPEPAVPPPSRGKAVAAGKSTHIAGTRRAVASPAKGRSPAAMPSATSSHSRTSLPSSASQPLRPQHTGQSASSSPPTTRQTRSVPRTAPSTPSRPKSSAGHNQAVPRPKTPSSGLFAPTVASLARSRSNFPSHPPLPVKKVTLSSDAAERLSKPTAASLSKARAPVTATPSPTRLPKPTSTGPHGPTPRGASKLKVARTPAKPKEEVVTGAASVSPELSHDLDRPAADHVENGHASGIAEVGSSEDTHSRSEVPEDAAHDPAADEEMHSDAGIYPPERQAGDRSAEDVHSHDHAQNLTEEEAVPEHEPVCLDVDDGVVEPAESHADQVVSNGDGRKAELAAPGGDIEDIVNMLEGSSLMKPRPQSIVSIPDEDGEALDGY